MIKIIDKIRRKIFSEKSVVVDIPTYERKREIIDGFRQKFSLNVLVETGTFMGDTVEYFRGIFSKVYSIELSEELAAKAKLRFSASRNVEIIQGDSGEVLARLVKGFREPALFWLDGHYSSEFFHNGEYIRTAKGDKDTPVEKELEVLLGEDYNHIILIDDARLFNGTGDYPYYSDIKRIVKRLKSNYAVENQEDIIRIFPIG